MRNYKIAMETFLMCHCQDGGKVCWYYEWRCQGIKRWFSKPKHLIIREHIKLGKYQNLDKTCVKLFANFYVSTFDYTYTDVLIS